MRVAKSLAGEYAKTPIIRRGGDILLAVNVSDIAMYSNAGQAASLLDLLGKEITVKIKLQKYSLTSKFAKNQGEKISGVSIKMIEASTVA